MECLFCDEKFKCDNSKSEEEIDRSLKEIDDNLERLDKVVDPKSRIRLQRMGNELKEMNRKFGNAHPSILFVIGRKVCASN